MLSSVTQKSPRSDSKSPQFGDSESLHRATLKVPTTDLLGSGHLLSLRGGTHAFDTVTRPRSIRRNGPPAMKFPATLPADGLQAGRPDEKEQSERGAVRDD